MHGIMGWAWGVATAVCAGAMMFGLGACKKSSARPEADGARTFATYCARCHGADGRGGLPLWDGGPSPRNFHDGAFQASRSDGDLTTTVRDGKPPGMPAFGAVLTPEELAAVVRHVRTLKEEGR